MNTTAPGVWSGGVFYVPIKSIERLLRRPCHYTIFYPHENVLITFHVLRLLDHDFKTGLLLEEHNDQRHAKHKINDYSHCYSEVLKIFHP